MQKIITLLIVCLSFFELSSQTYTFGLKQDASNSNLFTAFAVSNMPFPNNGFVNSLQISVSIPSNADSNYEGFIHGFGFGVGADWSVATTTIDGLDILIMTYNDTDGVENNFPNHEADEQIGLFSFEISNPPTSGFLELLDADSMISTNNGFENYVDADFTDDSMPNPTNVFVGEISGENSYNFEEQTLSNDSFFKSTFSLTPNPNNGQFTVSSAVPLGETTLVFYNITGQQVYRTTRNTFGKNTLSVNLTQKLAAGAYLISIETKEYKTMRKMVVVDR